MLHYLHNVSPYSSFCCFEVMTWGGLRGAVGLALVLSMRNLLILQGKEYTANLMAPWLLTCMALYGCFVENGGLPNFEWRQLRQFSKCVGHLVLVSVKETRAVYVVHHCTVYFEPFSVLCWTLAQRVKVFFVSGFATLTLLVNATTCGLLLKYLGLTKPPEAGWKVSASSESLEWPSCFSFLQVKGL